MQANPAVSIVLPCYNPAPGWMENVAANLKQIQQQGIPAEIILVNDGSSKNMEEQAATTFFIQQQLPVKVISYTQNKGKGYALRMGVKEAQNNIIIYTDIDFPYTQKSLIDIYHTLQSSDCDVAIGIRAEDYYLNLPKARVAISKFLRFIIRSFLSIPTDDTQCGLKGFNNPGKEIFLETTINRYLFDLEFIYQAAHKKVNLKTVKVELREGVQLSHMPWPILLQESGNFFKLFIKSIF